MPAFINIPANLVTPVMIEAVVQCDVVEEDTSTQEIINVWHLAANAGNAGGLSLAGLATSFGTWWNSLFPAVLSVDLAAPELTVRILDDPMSLAAGPFPLTPGAVAGDRLPTLAAVSIDLVTDARGRCFRGRKHIGPIAESSSTKDEIAAASLAAFNAVASGINNGVVYDDGAGNFFKAAVLSRINSSLVGPSVYFTYAIVQNGLLQVKIGTMKRRKEGVGA